MEQTATSLASEADVLRSDFAALLRVLAGESDGTASCEAPVVSFLQRARTLQQAFSAARLLSESDDRESDATLLREEVSELRRELEAKDALLAAHRERLRRWHEECTSIHAEAMALSVIETDDRSMMPKP